MPSETIGVFILQFGGLNLDLVEVLVEDPRVIRGHSVRYLPSVIIYYHKPAYMSTLFLKKIDVNFGQKLSQSFHCFPA